MAALSLLNILNNIKSKTNVGHMYHLLKEGEFVDCDKDGKKLIMNLFSCSCSVDPQQWNPTLLNLFEEVVNTKKIDHLKQNSVYYMGGEDINFKDFECTPKSMTGNAKHPWDSAVAMTFWNWIKPYNKKLFCMSHTSEMSIINASNFANVGVYTNVSSLSLDYKFQFLRMISDFGQKSILEFIKLGQMHGFRVGTIGYIEIVVQLSLCGKKLKIITVNRHNVGRADILNPENNLPKSFVKAAINYNEKDEFILYLKDPKNVHHSVFIVDQSIISHDSWNTTSDVQKYRELNQKLQNTFSTQHVSEV